MENSTRQACKHYNYSTSAVLQSYYAQSVEQLAGIAEAGNTSSRSIYPRRIYKSHTRLSHSQHRTLCCFFASTTSLYFEEHLPSKMAAVHWGGVVAIIVFYVLILLVGLWAARKTKNRTDSEEVMVAGRDIGMIIGIFTMTATWVGGGFLNGTAEIVYKKGLIFAQAPWGYSLSLVLGGIFFAKTMRERKYVTMLDPFQHKYGARVGGLMFIPALTGEVLWTSAILAALGATVSVILNFPVSISIIISACITITYSLFGGLYSVAYTDLVQLICMFFGLWLIIPFSMTHKAVSPLKVDPDWLGEWDMKYTGRWLDYAFLLMFGGIPWQAYFQRVLSSRTPRVAQVLSFSAVFGCLIMSVPAAIIGAIASKTDWNMTEIPDPDQPRENPSLVLPLVVQYLTPSVVSFIGLGAVSAAVMSSADSSILSSSSMFVRNIYKLLFRPKATEFELVWCMRVTMIVIGALATTISLTVQSVYSLFTLCGDFVYVVLFPQLVCVIHVPKVNTYGALTGYIVAFTLRLLGGDTTLKIPALIKYPGYDYEENFQYFPYRSFTMVIALMTILVVSIVCDMLFRYGVLKPEWDFFQCVVNLPPPNDKHEMSENLNGKAKSNGETNGGSAFVETEYAPGKLSTSEKARV